MKKFLLAMAIIFAILTVVCFISSARTVEGLDFKIANIQDTVFCAASAIISAINAVGYTLYSLMEKAHGVIPEEEKTEEQKEEEAKARAERIANAKPNKVVLFCDNCGIRKSEEELNIVKMKTRKGEVEKKICKECIGLSEVRNKIVR